jgi:hypothetical protein
MASMPQLEKGAAPFPYWLLMDALARKKPVRAMYEGRPRSICPHVIGRNAAGLWRVFAFQYGGTSQSGLPEEGSWRCLALDRLREVELLDEAWHTEPHAPQRCVLQVEAEAEVDYPEAPQNGQ